MRVIITLTLIFILSACSELAKVIDTSALEAPKPSTQKVVAFPKGSITSSRHIDTLYAALIDQLNFYNPPPDVIRAQPGIVHRTWGIQAVPGVSYQVNQPFAKDNGVVYPTYQFRERYLTTLSLTLVRLETGTRMRYAFHGNPSAHSLDVAQFVEKTLRAAAQ